MILQSSCACPNRSSTHPAHWAPHLGHLRVGLGGRKNRGHHNAVAKHVLRKVALCVGLVGHVLLGEVVVPGDWERINESFPSRRVLRCQ